MSRRVRVPSLRGWLIGSAVAAVVIGTVAMVVAFSTTLALRNEMDRDTGAFIDEQRIADQIVALSYAQQLETYRFLQTLDGAHRARFQALGDEADTQMRQYLFHVLSPTARLRVERMKERHEAFEVLAQRAFDLAQRGETAAARARLASLDSQAVELDSAVTRFLAARVAQRSALQGDYQALTSRVRVGLALVGFTLLALVAALVNHMRRRVVGPLEQLSAAAERIRGGDPLARVPAQHFQELKQVATAFNAMAESVQLSRETAELHNEELRQSLEQLQETQQELVQHEKLSAMGQMLAGLAHELNNPLSGVLGMAQLLRSELAASPDDVTRRIGAQLAEPLENEALRARDLVRSLLSFARKSSGTVEPVALHTAIGTAVALRSHAFVQAGRRLEMEIPPTLFVLADAQKLQHAVVNVVNNALDAIVAHQGNRLRIVAAVDGDAMVRVDFDDDGEGFRDPAAVFTPFYTTKPVDRGTGLGLTLVQQFIEGFGGTVSAANRAGGGARLTMLLRRADPVVPVLREGDVSAPAIATASRSDAATERVGVERSALDMRRAWGAKRPRVLVVDDEPSLREVQRRILVLEGLDVLVASSGDEARRIIAREPLDLIVSDLRMQGDSDGLRLLASLEHDYPHLARRALLVTGDLSAAAESTSLVPPERRLSKPFTRAEYVAHIRAALADWYP